jgi:hypothetical protein
MVMVVVIMQVNRWFAEYLVSAPYRLWTFPFAGWWIISDETMNSHEIQHTLLNNQDLTFLLPLLVLLACWYITYVRLSEKEI